MRKLSLLFGLAILVGLLVSAGVGAAAGKDPVVVKGCGTLYAKGVGLAEIHGDGSIVIQGHGVGAVWVRGAEALHVQGRGHRQPFRGGVLFRGWRGQIKAAGADVAVLIEGRLIEFTAQGTGSALLLGVGRYRIGNRSGAWLEGGLLIEYRTPRE